jgi:drug/metabolite transporter (DMT)-like permease
VAQLKRCIMPGRFRHRTVVLLLALGATVIWSCSLIVIKLFLQHVGPFQFIAVRNVIAGPILLAFTFAVDRRPFPFRMGARNWGKLVLLGVSNFVIFSGLMFMGLQRLHPLTVSFVLNFAPLVVLALSAVWLRELPSRFQLAGLVVAMLGAYLFFPPSMSSGEASGIILTIMSLLAASVATVITREFAVANELGTLRLTSISIGVSSCVLFLYLLLWGFPSLTLQDIAIIAALGLVSIAFASCVWNYTLKTLTAFESSLLGNVGPVETALLAWLILGDTVNFGQVAGMLLCIGGILVVQIHAYIPAISRFRSTSPSRERGA